MESSVDELTQLVSEVHDIHVLLYFLVTVGFALLLVYLILRPLIYFVWR